MKKLLYFFIISIIVFIVFLSFGGLTWVESLIYEKSDEDAVDNTTSFKNNELITFSDGNYVYYYRILDLYINDYQENIEIKNNYIKISGKVINNENEMDVIVFLNTQYGEGKDIFTGIKLIEEIPFKGKYSYSFVEYIEDLYKGSGNKYLKLLYLIDIRDISTLRSVSSDVNKECGLVKYKGICGIINENPDESFYVVNSEFFGITDGSINLISDGLVIDE